MFMAIAAETYKHPSRKHDYKVWYLEIDNAGSVVGIGVKTREEVLKSLFDFFRRSGKSNWRVFKKGAERSEEIEIYDFIAQNMNENTHFGNLPTLAEFQETLRQLELSLEIHSIAC